MSTASHDDIRQLRDAVRRVLGAAATESTPMVAPWRDGWPTLAELGVTGFCVPEDRGGSGWQVEAAVATALELGAALHGSPFASMNASAIALSGNGDPTSAALLEQMLAGTVVCGFASVDPSTGVGHLVDGAPDLDALIATLGDGGLRLYPDRSSFSVADAADGFDVTRTGGRVAIEPAAGIALGHRPEAVEIFGLLLAADSVGGIDRMLARTVDYARERIAFGKPIGANQAVQHRLVDHAVRVRGASLMVAQAARLLAGRSPGASRLVALTELSVSAHAPVVLNDLVQLTGGIGFTWEYGLHLYVRRAHRNARLAVNPWTAERRVARIEGWAR